MGYTPEEWKAKQQNGTDSFRSNVAGNVNELSDIVSFGENCVCAGLYVASSTYPNLTISTGVVIKDKEKLVYIENVALDFSDVTFYDPQPASINSARNASYNEELSILYGHASAHALQVGH